MFTRALQYWLTEYKVDGFRMDLSHGLCGTTNNALTHISDYYQNGVKAVAEDAYFILEHWGASAGDDWPKLINQGMMCWQNTSDAYHKAAAGSTGSSFSGANKRNYVSYCESHDEERMQYHARKSGVGNIKTDENVRLKRVAANVVFNVLLAGPHMIWQYEELGYDYSINSSETSPNSYSDGNRCTKKPRPETKGYFHHFVRMNQYTKIAQAIQLRTKLLADKFISLKQPSKATLGGVVRTIQWKDEVFVAGNFHASDEQVAKIPAGTWFDYYEQRPMTETEVVLAPGEFIILTGSEVALPEISTDFAFMSDVEDVIAPQPSEMLPPYNVRIYNINGQLMSQQTNAMSADLTGLNSGLYIVQYEKNGQRVAKKVIR
jgi:1,4-alpha-glucan branching enzyme